MTTFLLIWLNLRLASLLVIGWHAAHAPTLTEEEEGRYG